VGKLGRSGAGSRAVAPRSRSLRRDATVGLTSAAVMAFLVAYALISPTFALETSVSAAEKHAGSQAILHGRLVEADGDGIEDAEIRVSGPGMEPRVAHSGERGYFRLDLRGACAAPRIDVVVDAESLRTTLRRDLCPGEALELDARLVRASRLTWGPMS
jgi:hypothetical protein